MHSDWTPAVIRALSSARQRAQSAGSPSPDARHLLLGLLDEEEGRVSQLLQAQGLSLSQVRQTFGAEAPPAPPATAPTSRDLAVLSIGLEHYLYDARGLAAELCGEMTVASEHVLLAVLHRDSQLRQTLEQLGFRLERLEAQLQGEQGPPLKLDEPLTLLEPTDQIDTARILDANANRAREATRVLEDYCRFALDDAFLSGSWKELRHALAEACSAFGPHLFLEARDTGRDVGTSISTPSEERRFSLEGVVQANCKRLQEALRSLEEYGKLHSPDLGKAFEAMRYRSYSLERAVLLGLGARARLADVRLYVLLTGSLCTASIEWTIQEAAAGGARMFQLREKEMSDRELLARARDVRRWTHKARALFIMNDRPDIARLAEADGVHLGQDDMSVKDARRIVGSEAIIGVSTHRLEQARQAILDGANYLGVGPTFPSGTKPFETFAGLEYVRQVAAETTLPAFAIGGVTAKNVGQVVDAGLRRVAVSQAVCQADEPQVAARMIAQELG